jgi:hypothetical protein
MKKSILLFVAAVFSLTQLTAQESLFAKGDKVLSIGLGLGTSLYSGSYYSMTFPPLAASVEFGVKDGIFEKGSLGVGVGLGYTGYKYEYADWGWKYSNYILGARGYLHYPLVKKLDTYTGITLGYNISSANEFGTGGDPDYDYSSGGFIWAWFVGGRYYLKDNFALLAELGYGVTYLTLGVAFKF